jgi:hypothetical protein
MQHQVSAILFQDASAYAAELRERSELMQRARGGLVSGAGVLRYLTGMRYLTEQSVRLLELAAESSERHGDRVLAQHYRNKRQEEVGHHLWAESDMRGVASTFGLRAEHRASRALHALVAFLEREIAAAPESYLAYGLLVEHVTVVVGPDWITALEQACGVPRSHLSVVENHVRLDREHVEEGLAEIDALTRAAQLPGMRETIRVAISHLDHFMAELLELGEAA